jgi:hypothetical protein
MTKRENILRAIRFEEPEYIPMAFGISPACWHYYDQNNLQDLIQAHPFLFPDFKRQERRSPDERDGKIYGALFMNNEVTEPADSSNALKRARSVLLALQFQKQVYSIK